MTPKTLAYVFFTIIFPIMKRKIHYKMLNVIQSF